MSTEALGFSDFSSATVDRHRSFDSDFRMGGIFNVVCEDSEGNVRWSDTAKNVITDAGMVHTLATEFLGGTPVTTWYIGIVDNSGWTAFNFGDTMGSHATWTEQYSGYTQSTRVAWTPGASGSSPNWTVTNSSTCNFTITGAGFTAKGIFLCSDSTKNGTSGTLMSTAAFTGGTQAVNSGDTLKVTYTITGTAS